MVAVPSQDLDFQRHHMSWFFWGFSEFSEDERRLFVLLILLEMMTITI
jgi:hypothetical protein